MVCTAPIDNLQWYYYNSIVSAPSERFEQELPTLWEIWKSWSVNPAVFRERMDAALRSVRARRPENSKLWEIGAGNES
jgi:hypothetical protein